MSTTRFEFEGELELWEQEGGHADAAIVIGDCSGLGIFLLDELRPSIKRKSEFGSPQGTVEGRWRITVERIDED